MSCLHILKNVILKINYNEKYIYNVVDQKLLRLYKLELQNYNNKKYIFNPLITTRIINIHNNVINIINKNNNSLNNNLNNDNSLYKKQ